jgi:hypothetical protein
MLFQVLLNIIVFLLRMALWIIMALVVIPFGIYMLLLDQFPTFVLAYGFGFWSVFFILIIIAYVILWKPILWVVGVVGILGAGQE